jgi:hypothetical protein
MRTQILTLIDVTNTNARRNDDDQKEYAQQSNLNTLIQTASLRANLVPLKIELKHGGISTLGFGTEFTGKHRYWVITFEDERDTPLSDDMFKDDFDLVPITTGLNETAEVDQPVIRTRNSKYKNISFRSID